MKIKDLEKTVNIAWSPAPQHPILLATGTAAQQLDASFNTNAALEIHALNLSDASMDLQMRASTSSENRFHRVVWGPGAPQTRGFIVGGCDGGVLQIYDADKLLASDGAPDCLVSRQDKHTGAVAALDFNPFQHNLLASGASDSEIYIWDLNNTSTPMTPGAKAQPLETVQCVSWNRQVQHILATAFATRCVVWDLRKNEPIIKLTDGAAHVRWKSVCWHPEVATQLCLASEDDQTPVIQLWDLRFATAPLKVLDNHRRGVLAVDWCVCDSDLLISCGKDNRILCWNPNSNEARGEVLAEVAQTLQWNFDISWCPRNPAVFAAASFDGHVSIYSLMGGKQQQVQTSNKIADSFPGMDGYVQAPLPQQAPPVSVDLAKAPKWLKRPVGASFAFGGRLISFENEKNEKNERNERNVVVSQVVTEPDLVRAANLLEEALQVGNYAEYCRQKADSSTNQHDRYIWHFLKANFEDNPKLEMLNLLGFFPDDINSALAKKTEQLSQIDLQDKTKLNENDPNYMFDNLSISDDNVRKLSTPYKIKTGDDTDGLITQAILVGNIETAVDLCVDAGRMADALIIAMTGGADLLARTQHRYLQQSSGYVSALISALVSENWGAVVASCHVASWKEALAALLTYCTDDELPQLCEKLGDRLARECGDIPNLLEDAQLCYISAGAFNKLVASWGGRLETAQIHQTHQNLQNPQKLQELMELVKFMQKAIEHQGRTVEVTGNLATFLKNYAILLASQGNFANAVNYLGAASDPALDELRDRLYHHLGRRPLYFEQQQPQQQQQQQQQPQHQNVFNPRKMSQPWSGGAPPAQAFSPGPQNVQPQAPPPRPNSASGPRNKYVVDPSVQSGYAMRGALPPAPMGPHNPGANAPVQHQPQMQMMSSMGAPPHVYNNNAVGATATAPPLPGGMPPHPQEMMHPMMQAAPGWNDPPVVTKNVRPQPKSDIMPPTPITHPLFGGQQQQQQQQQGGAIADCSPQNGYGDPPPPSSHHRHQNAPQFNTMPQAPYVPVTPISQITPVTPITPITPVTPASEQAHEVVAKAPLPEEHMYLQTVFNELQAQCSCAANNPQTKRKLEDVSRKLETLYDMLRAHKLSPQTLAGLHQMVQLVQIGDYTNGLGLHTQLVSGPDFSQIASFMPGLKVLLQCALQLQVYLR